MLLRDGVEPEPIGLRRLDAALARQQGDAETALGVGLVARHIDVPDGLVAVPGRVQVLRVGTPG